MWGRPGSVEVERCADRVGEAGFLMIQEPADLIAERGRGNRRDAIARDNAPVLETVRSTKFDFGREPADHRGDRCDGDRVEVRRTVPRVRTTAWSLPSDSRDLEEIVRLLDGLASCLGISDTARSERP
jgi:hypothetical protein